jgi:molecular chaperone DnaK
MVKEAEAHKAEDDRRREEAETKNKAESYINTMEQRMAEVGDKVSEEVTNQLKADIADLRNDMNNLPASELKNKLPEYEQKFARYEQAAQQAGAGYQAPNYDNPNNSSSDDEGPINA